MAQESAATHARPVTGPERRAHRWADRAWPDLQGLDALQAPPAQWQSPAVQVAAAVAVVSHPVVVYSALAGIAVWAFRRRLRNLTLAVLGAIALGWGGQEVLRGLFDWLGEVYDQNRVESVLATPHSRRGNHRD